VAVDKTGTLTEGRPQLTDVIVLDPMADRTDVLSCAAAAEAGSEHRLASPIVAAAQEQQVAPEDLPDDVTPVPGKGIVASINGHRVLIGNAALLAQYGISDDDGADQTAHQVAADGKTPMIVVVNDHVVGVIGVADQIRADEPQMVAQLHDAGGKKVVVFTDNALPEHKSVGRTIRMV